MHTSLEQQHIMINTGLLSDTIFKSEYAQQLQRMHNRNMLLQRLQDHRTVNITKESIQNNNIQNIFLEPM